MRFLLIGLGVIALVLGLIADGWLIVMMIEQLGS
jgi:hypothetical protein